MNKRCGKEPGEREWERGKRRGDHVVRVYSRIPNTTH